MASTFNFILKYFLNIFVFVIFSSIGIQFTEAEVGNSATSSVVAAPPLHSPQLQSQFVSRCMERGIRELFCRQITSPNTHSEATFREVYGSQPFILMPERDSWDTGIELLIVAESLAAEGEICQIRNWYRPEPYNRAVSGARRSQHLNASAIDIEFCSVEEKNKALLKVLALRREYQLPAGVGVYGEGSLVIHIDMSNRIYGDGIARADRLAAKVDVERPGTNLTSNVDANSVSRSANTGARFQPVLYRPRPTNYYRQIIDL